MTFVYSDKKIQWSSDFGSDFVSLTVTDLVQKLLSSFHGFSLPAWNSLLSERQKFVGERLAQIATTPNHLRTYEKRGEIFANAGAQDMDTRGYELLYMRDIDFF